MNVYEYIASNNPREANYLLSGYGYKKTLSKKEISENLKAFVRKNKAEGLKELADIHPDKDLILSSLAEDKVTVSTDEQMNFAGVSGQEYVQNLQTNTYWTPNNPKRPISPDFFYNSNGTPSQHPSQGAWSDSNQIDEGQLAEKISSQIQKDIVKKENQKEILEQIKSIQNIQAPTLPRKSETKFTMTHLVIMSSSLFLGYFLYKNLK